MTRSRRPSHNDNHDFNIPEDADPLVYGVTHLLQKTEFLARPRTLTVGFFTTLFFLYAIFKDTPETADLEYNVKRGIKYGCIFFLIYCVCELRDGHFVRPHPVFWRLVTGLLILYEMFLIFLLFQETDDARQLMKHLDPSLGVELPERGYGSDCRLYTPENPESNFKNLKDTFLDEFVIMHSVGWYFGTLMIRDYFMCWMVSILFEVYEITFAHWLPNFHECWWDHVFFDILICNALGIYLGMKTCAWLEMKHFNWWAIKQDARAQSVARRALANFLPASWISYRWGVFESPTRFLLAMVQVVMISIMLLNAFFLKAILWIPPPNYLNVVRLLIVFSGGSYGIAEYYLFFTRPFATKLGPRAWLGIGVLLTELVFIIKHKGEMFSEPFPPEIKLGWQISSAILVVFFTCFFTWKAQVKKKALLEGKTEEIQSFSRANGKFNGDVDSSPDRQTHKGKGKKDSSNGHRSPGKSHHKQNGHKSPTKAKAH